jgi:hypothetical protein
MTGCPHFKQDEVPAGKLAPHLLQMDRAGIMAAAAFSAAVFWPHFRQNCEPSGSFVPHQLHNTLASLWPRFGVTDCGSR